MKARRHVFALLWCLGAWAALVGSPVQAQAPDYSKVEFRSEKLGDHLFVLFGAGGLVTIRQRVADLIRKGRSLEQIKAAAPSREFDERWGKGFFSPDAFVQRVYIELNRKPGPR